MKNLIVVRCGKNSCHHYMMHENSQFDVWEIPYQPVQKNKLTSYTTGVIGGPKFNSLYQLFLEKEEWHKYDYIWIPDDDIRVNHQAVNTLFQEAAKDEIALAQPSLDEQSYYSHPITLNHPFFRSRSTNFVEVMAPLFSKKALLDCLWTFTLNKSGWGLEYLWHKIINSTHEFSNDGHLRIYDCIKVCHTRPVGGQSRGVGKIDPYDELYSLLDDWNIIQSYYNFAIYLERDDTSTPIKKGSLNFKQLLAKSCLQIINRRSIYFKDEIEKRELHSLINNYHANNIL